MSLKNLNAPEEACGGLTPLQWGCNEHNPKLVQRLLMRQSKPAHATFVPKGAKSKLSPLQHAVFHTREDYKEEEMETMQTQACEVIELLWVNGC